MIFIECVLKWIHSLFDCWFGQLNEDWNVGSRCKRVVVDGLILMVMEKKEKIKIIGFDWTISYNVTCKFN